MGIFCCLPDPIDFDGDVNLFHFDLHRAIGKGAFGKVRVVEHKKTKKLYALKYISKQQCVKQKAVSNVIQERQLLEEIDHPFVVNLRYAFQDDANCFFALDLMLGGDLRFHLERKGTVEEETVKFWTAELSSALAYLHKQRIIHRDIKPDNILLDANGHAHLTDFNVAIHYSSSRLHTSVAGSLAYMAPEVCGRKGYSWQVDWWSLGICAYELLFGRRPFEGRTTDALTQSICRDPLKLPDGAREVLSEAGISALKQLIDKSVKRRLGCRAEGQDLETVKAHPWFADIDWATLDNKEAQAPFVPDMRKGNFDITHELDEFLMVEKPLTHTKRKQNVDLDNLSPEYRQLEERFTNFDFTKPKRMSYYPHNQSMIAGSTIAANEIGVQSMHEGGMGEGSMDLPRRSSNSNTLTVGATTTTAAGGEESPKDSDSPTDLHEHHQQHQQFYAEQPPYPPSQSHAHHQAQESADMDPYGGASVVPLPPSHPSTPSQPERAFVRTRPSGDGNASLHGGSVHGVPPPSPGLPPPRMSSASQRSGHSVRSGAANIGMGGSIPPTPTGVAV